MTATKAGTRITAGYAHRRTARVMFRNYSPTGSDRRLLRLTLMRRSAKTRTFATPMLGV